MAPTRTSLRPSVGVQINQALVARAGLLLVQPPLMPGRLAGVRVVLAAAMAAGLTLTRTRLLRL